MTEEALTTNNGTELFSDPSLREMIDAGVFLGRVRTKTNPKMKSFILTNRNGVEIIDIEKTKELFDKALDFLKEKVKAGSLVLFVGTQPGAVDSVLKVAQEFNYPSVITRWLGGTLTNFRVISKRIEYYKKLKADWQNPAFREKYVKKERVGIEKELEKLEIEMSSLENLISRPGVLVVIDPNSHMAAIREANKLKIPVISFVNTDTDPDLINYPVPGNNKARVSINWFLDKIVLAIREAKKEIPPVLENGAGEKTEKQNGNTGNTEA